MPGQHRNGLVGSGGAYVVTGAGSGINLAVARGLLAAGCTVAAWDLKPGSLASEQNERLLFTAVDVCDAAGLREAAERTAAAAGGIAGLVAGAGIMINAPFLEIREADFDRTFAVNVKGAMLTVQAVLPFLRKQEAASIVMFSSMLARSGGPNAADYIASKGAVLGLARSLAAELAPEGIRVNTVSPTLVDTPMPRHVYSRERFAARGTASPMGRLADADEVAAAALFLLSDDASFVTGQDLRISGGERLF